MRMLWEFICMLGSGCRWQRGKKFTCRRGMAVTALSRESAENALEFCARRCSRRLSLSPAAARLALYPAQAPRQTPSRASTQSPADSAAPYSALLVARKVQMPMFKTIPALHPSAHPCPLAWRRQGCFLAYAGTHAARAARTSNLLQELSVEGGRRGPPPGRPVALAQLHVLLGLALQVAVHVPELIDRHLPQALQPARHSRDWPGTAACKGTGQITSRSALRPAVCDRLPTRSEAQQQGCSMASSTAKMLWHGQTEASWRLAWICSLRSLRWRTPPLSSSCSSSARRPSGSTEAVPASSACSMQPLELTAGSP